MSTKKRPGRSYTPPARKGTPPSRRSRGQVTFWVLSVFVVCGMLGAAFVSLTWDQITDGLGLDDPSSADEENFVDENADLIGDLETQVAENPEDIDNTILLANLLGNTGRASEAIPLYEKVLEARPDDVATRLSFARMLADGGFPQDAELQFLKLLEQEPDNQQAHYYLAELYRKWSPPRLEEAIPHYQRVVELDPSTQIAALSQQQLDILGLGTPIASPVATPTRG